MRFCPRCGTRLSLKFTSKGSLYCPKCGQRSNLNKRDFSEVKHIRSELSTSAIVVLDKKAMSYRALPTINFDCQKCGGQLAETWSIPLGSNDTFEAIFYRCVSCGYTLREND